MLKEAKLMIIEHLKQFYGNTCTINLMNKTIKDIEYIRNNECLILTKDVKYNKEKGQFYYYFNNNKEDYIALKSERVGKCLLEKTNEIIYALILNERDFITSNESYVKTKSLPSNYVKEYENIKSIAKKLNELNYTIKF